MKFKWWEFLLVIIILIVLVLNYFFNYHFYNPNNQLNNTTDNSRIIGEKLNVLSKYVKSKNYCENYIFIYHDSDCGGCIRSGYKLLRDVNKKKYRILLLTDLKMKGEGKINNGTVYKEENVDLILKKMYSYNIEI